MFPLPPEYAAAVQLKEESVSKLRGAVKSVRRRCNVSPVGVCRFTTSTRAQANLPEEKKREVQSIIQSYFREWLTSSGRMRQIYDLARLEKDAETKSGL